MKAKLADRCTCGFGPLVVVNPIFAVVMEKLGCHQHGDDKQICGRHLLQILGRFLAKAVDVNQA